MVGVRRKIAQKMTPSKHTAAHFTFVEECDATALEALRARLKGTAEARGVGLTFLPFVVKAVVAALKKHPTLNTTFDEGTNEIVFRKYFHIGVATATEAGLIVPVVRDADKKSVLEIARDIERLSSEVRGGKARPEDLTGSTFTITSLGAKGGLFATPIINFPEVAIPGVHQMKSKPVVRDGQIVIGDVMLLSLSFDHRIVDGHVGAAFALEVIAYPRRPRRPPPRDGLNESHDDALRSGSPRRRRRSLDGRDGLRVDLVVLGWVPMRRRMPSCRGGGHGAGADQIQFDARDTTSATARTSRQAVDATRS